MITCTKTCYVQNKRGDVKVIKPSDTITRKFYNGLTPQQQAKFEIVRVNNGRDVYTTEEEWSLATMINDGLPVNEIVANFINEFGTHSPGSIQMMIRQAVNVETDGIKGVSHLTKSFIDKLIELDPVRFA